MTDKTTAVEQKSDPTGNKPEHDKDISLNPDTQSWNISPEFRDAMEVLAGADGGNDDTAETADEV